MRKFLSRLAGTSEESNLRPLQPLVDKINELEAHYQALSDDDIRAEMAEVRDEVRSSTPATEPPEAEDPRARQRSSCADASRSGAVRFPAHAGGTR